MQNAFAPITAVSVNAPDRVRTAGNYSDRLRFEPQPIERRGERSARSSSQVEEFLASLPDALDDLRSACEHRDADGVRDAAKRIRQAAHGVGGLGVASLATQLEVACLQNQPPTESQELIRELCRASSQLFSVLTENGG